jgi:hypothetical protein
MGLCNGRLYSCMGHHVQPNLPNIVLHENNNIITLLRHPWSRLQSDYYYIKYIQMSGAHMNIQNSTIVENILNGKMSLFEYITLPEVSNCMTKV